MLSLRARLLLGAVLWTIGLFFASMATMAVVWFHHPDLPLLGRTGSIHTWVQHTVPILAIALACMIAGVVQVRRGLAGITQLRRRLAAVHGGRGVRADEKAPGSGLGLAIVRDLAEVYGGSITLEDSPIGGVRARLVLPKVAAPPPRSSSAT